MSRFIPVFHFNIPNGGMQKIPPPLKSNTPIYSSYTGKKVAEGPIKFGHKNDAPKDHKNYGKTFHVIQYNQCNDSFMVHSK